VIRNVKAQHKPHYDSRCACVLQLVATVLSTADGCIAGYHITKYGLSCTYSNSL